MPQFGLFISSEAERHLDRLNYRQLALFSAAREVLLEDPTEGNDFEFDVSDVPPHRPGDYALLWGEIIVVFRFATDSVIEVLAVFADNRSE